MNKHHPQNERMKRRFLSDLKNARGRSVDLVDAVAAAIARFEEHTRYQDFKKWHPNLAISFKEHMLRQKNPLTGSPLSKSTLVVTLGHLRHFFQWLSDRSGYMSRIRCSDADYFNLSANDMRIANARRPRPVPTLQQVRHVVASMPATTDIERRNRALVAFTLLTGARDMAIASTKLKHVDLKAGSVLQDSREVKTKFRKTIVTYFMPVGTEVRQIFDDWFVHLRDTLLWGNDDPLFPATRMELGPTLQFQAVGLDHKHWSTASPIRAIFRSAFSGAGLQYFNPHSVRFTVAHLGMQLCRTAEEMKAWSQNMGHAHVLTTIACYGEVGEQQQGDIVRRLEERSRKGSIKVADLTEELMIAIKKLQALPPEEAG
ncbi:MAG TPA: tyrosine-type recombinase/integrase [Xanthomonadaceae bacterium]|jgi:integrase